MIDRKPSWIKTRLSTEESFKSIRVLNRELKLRTVCKQALCPNIRECWSKGNVTFMILGDSCTRNCKFCNIELKKTRPPDREEPFNIAKAVKELSLDYVVITSVTRDDLSDFGLSNFIATVREIRNKTPDVVIELLIPDFKAVVEYIKNISRCDVEIVGHNLEMGPRLYDIIKPQADYNISLKTLKLLKKFNPRIITKTALMVGLGEEEEELEQVFYDILTCDVDILYIGQYLQPSNQHIDVKRYYSLEEFESLRQLALHMGIKVVKAGPMVRSSYKAKESYMEVDRG